MDVKKKNRAFTLIELVVALSVAAILAAMAAPSFSAFIKNNRLTTQINALASALNVARSEAIKRSSTITLCASNDNASCTGDWEDGWIIFVDLDDDEVVDSGETVLLVHDALPSNMAISYNGVDNGITYEASGYAYQASTFLLCDDRGANYGKGLALSLNGRPRLMESSEITSCS